MTAFRTGALAWTDAVAVVGLSCRFPGARNVQEYWTRIASGESMLSQFSRDELRLRGVPDDLLSNPFYVRTGTTLPDADRFDARLFGYSPRDAEIIDPQQRVFLECAWEALEHAGYGAGGTNTGVFAGVGPNSYLLSNLLPRADLHASVGIYQLILANDKDYLSTRVAYKLNLHGPAATVQTACSSSLAAVHLACRSLLSDECEMALAGGVSITSQDGVGYLYAPGMILSADGHCRPFDARANGTVPGRGAGIVVLKRLSAAISDGDTIYGVIRGSAWNNDGAGKVGFTAPSVDAQSRAMTAAYRAAGADVRAIRYMEAHGTGTELGDPIEMAALTGAFRPSTSDRGFCAIGSVKANMGHADAAAGIAGLIKAVMALHKGVIPPQREFETPNPQLKLESSPFFVNTTPISLPSGVETWAAVNAAGIGGTNTHVCLSSYTAPAAVQAGDGYRLLTMSAATEAALATSMRNLAGALDAGVDLGAVSFTLQRGRAQLPVRFAVLARSRSEAVAALRNAPGARPSPERPRGVVFAFPGQGEQYAGMASALYEADEDCRSLIDRASESLLPELGLDLRDLLCRVSDPDRAQSLLLDTRFAQPALFVMESAIAGRWMRLGMRPAALIGHSIGELTAACIAGLFDFEDALRLSAVRGRVMTNAERGRMIAVACDAERVPDYLVPNAWVAAFNSARQTVIAGVNEAVAAVEQRLNAAGIAWVTVNSRHAFHTPLLAQAARDFAREVATVTRRQPSIPWLSNVTGTWADPDEATSPGYWARHIVSPVRFADNMSTAAAGGNCFLEAGPGATLTALLRSRGKSVFATASWPSARQKDGGDRVFLEAVAKLWEAQLPVRLEAVQQGPGRRIPLPTYPFDRERCWIDAALPPAPPPFGRAEPGRLKRNIEDSYYAPSWRPAPPTQPEAAGNSPWLVLCDFAELGARVADELQRRGCTVVRAVMNPLTLTNWTEVCRDLGSSHQGPWSVACCWALDTCNVDLYAEAVAFVQSAAKARIRLRCFDIVSDSLESVGCERMRNPERAQLLGLALALPVENKNARSRHIDVHVGESTWVPQVTGELLSSPDNGSVALRGGARWVKEWESVRFAAQPPAALRRGGLYLIAGGFGGIGATLARYLASEWQARLVLTSRSSVDSRRHVELLQELENSGAEARAYTADVADPLAMKRVVEDLVARMGCIHGAINAAGLPGGRLIAGQDAASAAEVSHPKVAGSRVLADVLDPANLDFLLLCSSISSVVPAPGQSAYAGANAFLDHFAAWCRTERGIRAISLHYDAWRDAGMALNTALPDGMDHLRRQRLEFALTNEEGIAAFQRALEWNHAELLVSTTGLPEALEAAYSAASPVPQPDDGGSGVAVTGEALGAMLFIWREVLGVKDVGADDNFFDLGGHSLSGTMVLTRVREQFGNTLTLRDLFEAPTPNTFVLRIGPPLAAAVPCGAGDAPGREQFEF